MIIGNVEIVPEERLVLVSNQPFKLGAKACELLELLASARGELLPKDEIMRRLWPGKVVGENNLHVHISTIRKMLGSRAHLLVAVSGRGYRLAVDAPRAVPCTAMPQQSDSGMAISNLPVSGSILYGRELAIDDVAAACGTAPIVSLVGAGGIGKTSLAIEVGRRFIGALFGDVLLVDLAKVTAPQCVARAVENVLESVAGHEIAPLDISAASLKGRRSLIILDNCEHVIRAAAQIAEIIAGSAPDCHVIATSREPLKASGEVVYSVPALEVPLVDERFDDIVQRSAVQLFLNRARAVDSLFVSDEHGVVLAGEICRRLDGLPLAIELAASRAATLGIEALAANLDNRFAILNDGYRTALPQHQSLRATLDWSYGLLSKNQRAVLRKLSVFPSAFGVEAAISVAAEEGLSKDDVIDAICALVDKSLLIAQSHDGACRYKLLETSRAYALQKMAENGEDRETERLFVHYVCSQLQRTLSTACANHTVVEDFWHQLDDMRAALQATFASGDGRALGLEIITMAAPLLFRLGMFAEVQQHARAALSAWRDYEQTQAHPDAGTRLLHVLAGSLEWAGASSSRTGDPSSPLAPGEIPRMTQSA